MIVDRTQVDEIRRLVGDELSRVIADSEQRDGVVIAGENRRMLAHKLIANELQNLDAQSMNAGADTADRSRQE